MTNFIEMLDKMPELRKYKHHFEKIKDNYMQRLEVEMHEYHKYRRNDRYYVLCHGDFHLRNMMFRHNKELGAYDDVMLVDFQLSNLCPITVDLTYSVYMLMEPEQRWEMGENLINEYFSVLVATLRKIGYKGICLPKENCGSKYKITSIMVRESVKWELKALAVTPYSTHFRFLSDKHLSSYNGGR